MKNNLNIIIASMLVLTISGLFYVKDQVKYLKQDLAEINRQIADSKMQIHVLEAEWQYLNNPERIRNLSENYLDLKPVNVSQYSDPENFNPVNMAILQQTNNTPTIASIYPNLKPVFISY